MSKAFQPRTRQMDERQITREQRDFSAGMFDDIPSTAIPNNGVAYLKNIKNVGTNLVGRTGSKEWGDISVTGSEVPAAILPSIASGISVTSTITGSLRTVTVVTGYSFTDDNIGDYFVFDDGTHERISDVNSTTEFETRTKQTLEFGEVQTDSSGWIRQQVNGMHYHKLLKKIIILIGRDIYIARDLVISSWDKCYCESYDKPTNTSSIFEEINNDVILFNTYGIYKIPLIGHPDSTVFYYKLNSEVPINRLTDSILKEGDSGANHLRRYTYGLAKISGSGQDRNRQSSGIVLKIDSGTVLPDSNYKDFSEYWFSGAITSGTSGGQVVSGFQLPSISSSDSVLGIKEKHWDVYTVWGTADIGPSGIDPLTGEGNNTELYGWLADIPISKSYSVSGTGTTLTVCSGSVSEHDIGSTLIIISGSGTGTILTRTITSGISGIGSGSLMINSTITLGSQFPAFIGAKSGCLFTVTSDGIITSVSGNYLTSGDVGRRLFVSDGTVLHISGVRGSGSGTSGFCVEHTSGTLRAGCWGEASRNFYDNISDDKLKPRFTGYPLYQRFYKELPITNIGTVVPGWLFAANRDDNFVYYSQIADGFEYLAGYYHPTYQQTMVKDGIRAFGNLLNKLAVYCANSTSIISLESIKSISIPEIGVDISVLDNISLVDNYIGVLDYGSICDVEMGKQILITNEPAIRIFDGNKYSENFASKKITNILKTLRSATSAVYSSYTGYIFWGNNE